MSCLEYSPMNKTTIWKEQPKNAALHGGATTEADLSWSTDLISPDARHEIVNTAMKQNNVVILYLSLTLEAQPWFEKGLSVKLSTSWCKELVSEEICKVLGVVPVRHIVWLESAVLWLIGAQLRIMDEWSIVLVSTRAYCPNMPSNKTVLMCE